MAQLHQCNLLRPVMKLQYFIYSVFFYKNGSGKLFKHWHKCTMHYHHIYAYSVKGTLDKFCRTRSAPTKICLRQMSINKNDKKKLT